MYTLLALKRSGMPTDALKKFYISCIGPKIRYVCPSWFAMITQEQGTRFRRVESLVLQILAPQGRDYNDRLSVTGIEPILTVLDITSKQYIDKIKQNDRHCLHQLLHVNKAQAATRRSTRLSTVKLPPMTRTTLRSECPLIYYH